jgi:hypothetical protein
VSGTKISSCGPVGAAGSQEGAVVGLAGVLDAVPRRLNFILKMAGSHKLMLNRTELHSEISILEE